MRQSVGNESEPDTLPDSARALLRAFAGSRDGLLVTDRDGSPLGWNERHGARFQGGQHPLDPATTRRVRDAALADGEHAVRVLITDAHGVPIEHAIEVFCLDPLESDSPPALAWVTRRVASRSELEVELSEALATVRRDFARLLETDEVTGVSNRQGLTRALSDELDRARRDDRRLIAALVDCDNFRCINDRLGFAVGDIVLREIARRLQEATQRIDSAGTVRRDLIARIGGDQFLVILPAETTLDRATQVAERIRLAVCSSPILIADDVVDITISVGIIEVPRVTSTLEEVLTVSYRALDVSKRGGKNRVSSSGQLPAVRIGEPMATFEAEDTLVDVPQPSSLESVYRQLLGRPGVRAFWQPIVRLADEVEIGHEMLARGPRGPFESPAHFFRVSLEANILTAVDLRCLKTCIDTARLSSSNQIHLNVFPSTLLATPSHRLLELMGDEQERFVVELSEQQYLGDVNELRPCVEALRRAGVRVALDDVGFGRSSFEALLVLEPDIVKIDRSVVRDAGNDLTRSRLLARLVSAVHALGAELVAEGIETRGDLELARELQIELGQGYLWGRPVACSPEAALVAG